MRGLFDAVFVDLCAVELHLQHVLVDCAGEFTLVGVCATVSPDCQGRFSIEFRSEVVCYNLHMIECRDILLRIKYKLPLEVIKVGFPSKSSFSQSRHGTTESDSGV